MRNIIERVWHHNLWQKQIVSISLFLSLSTLHHYCRKDRFFTAVHRQLQDDLMFLGKQNFETRRFKLSVLKVRTAAVTLNKYYLLMDATKMRLPKPFIESIRARCSRVFNSFSYDFFCDHLQRQESPYATFCGAPYPRRPSLTQNPAPTNPLNSTGSSKSLTRPQKCCVGTWFLGILTI